MVESNSDDGHAIGDGASAGDYDVDDGTVDSMVMLRWWQ